MAKMKYDEPMQIVSLRMPISMVKKLKRMSYMNNRYVSEIIIGMIKSSLKYL